MIQLEWIILTTLFLLLVVAIFFLIYTLLDFIITSVRRNKFLKAFEKGIANETLTDWFDIEMLFSAVYHAPSVLYHAPSNEQSNEIMAHNLRRFLMRIFTSKQKFDDNSIEWKTKIAEFLRESEKRSPYEKLPAEERAIIQRIEMHVNDGNVQYIDTELKELSAIITAKHSKNSSRNKWGLILTTIGVIATVLFGIITIVIS